MSTPKYDGGAAYPVPMFTRQADGQPMSAGEFFEGGNGMSLRDYFAAAALPSLISVNLERMFSQGMSSVDFANTIGVASYEVADAMLTARNR